MCLVLVGACMCLVCCGTNYNYDASGFSVGETELTSALDNIYIDWLGGSVKVEYHAADTVTLAESGAKNDDMRLRWKLTDDNSLFVKYCAPRSRVVVGVGKKLTLTLPENFRATNIEFDTVAASVTTAVLSVQKIKANTVSGNVSLWVANTQSVTVDTVSGRIDVVQNGTADTIDVDTTSGAVAIQADNAKFPSIRLPAVCPSPPSNRTKFRWTPRRAVCRYKYRKRSVLWQRLLPSAARQAERQPTPCKTTSTSTAAAKRKFPSTRSAATSIFWLTSASGGFG